MLAQKPEVQRIEDKQGLFINTQFPNRMLAQFTSSGGNSKTSYILKRMELFDSDGTNVKIHPAAYTLTPFKKIVSQKNKTLALKELAFIFFYSDYKSDFSDILNEEEKKQEIKTIVELPEKWEPSEDIKEAIKFYKKRQQTPSMQLLEAALSFVQKLKVFYTEVDLNERDERTGKLIHSISQLQKGASEIGELTSLLERLKESIAKEVEAASRIRGGGEIGLFEDPD